MSFTPVQQLSLKLIDSVTGASTFTMPANFTSGNSCVVSLAVFNSAITSVVVNGVTATRKSSSTATSAHSATHAEIWIAEGLPGGGNTVVVTPNGAGQFVCLGAVECSGLVSSGSFDVQAVNTPTNTAAPAVTSPTLAQAQEVAFAAMAGETGNVVTITQPAGWTAMFAELDGANHQVGAGAFLDLTSRGTTASVTATWGYTDSDPAQQTTAAIATFKISTGAIVQIALRQNKQPTSFQETIADDRIIRKPWLPVSGAAVVSSVPFYRRTAVVDLAVEDQIKRRPYPVVLLVPPDPPPLVQYDTSDLDPGVYDDLRIRRPWFPAGDAVATQQVTPARKLTSFDEGTLEERISRRAWYPGSADRPILTPRRAPEEFTSPDLQVRKPWYPGSTDAAPHEQHLSVFDENAAPDLLVRRGWLPTGSVQAGDQPPRVPKRVFSDELLPDERQRRPWIPVSGPLPDSAPNRRVFAVTDESAPDGIQRRPWFPTGPIPDQPPRQRARVLADDALPDERQRRPWLPVSGPVLQQQALARPRGVLDEAIEERLQRRPWLPVSSDAPVRRAGRLPADEAQHDERLARRQWAPVGTAPDAPPSISRVRVVDERTPDELRRKPWQPEGAPVVRDNPPSRVIRVFADDAYPDELRRRPWLPVSGPVIPHFGGEARLYYRMQSARVRISE